QEDAHALLAEAVRDALEQLARDAAAADIWVDAEPQDPAVGPRASALLDDGAEDEADEPLVVVLGHEAVVGLGGEKLRQLVLVPGAVQARPALGGEQPLAERVDGGQVLELELANVDGARRSLRDRTFAEGALARGALHSSALHSS